MLASPTESRSSSIWKSTTYASRSSFARLYASPRVALPPCVNETARDLPSRSMNSFQMSSRAM
jgi:hypothetical protein